MLKTITVYFKEDAYDVTYTGNVILHVIKYCGESQFPMDVDFNNLHGNLQDLIIKRIRDNEQSDTE